MAHTHVASRVDAAGACRNPNRPGGPRNVSYPGTQDPDVFALAAEAFLNLRPWCARDGAAGTEHAPSEASSRRARLQRSDVQACLIDLASYCKTLCGMSCNTRYS